MEPHAPEYPRDHSGAITFLVVMNIIIALCVLYDTLVIHHIVQDLAQLGVQIT